MTYEHACALVSALMLAVFAVTVALEFAAICWRDVRRRVVRGRRWRGGARRPSRFNSFYRRIR
jgi:hypothetical protein